MDFKVYLEQQLDKAKEILSSHEEILKQRGYCFSYECYWENDVDEQEIEIQNGYIEIGIRFSRKKKTELYKTYCICENIGGEGEAIHEIDEFIGEWFSYIQKIERGGFKALKKIVKQQTIESIELLRGNTLPVKIFVRLGPIGLLIVTFIIAIFLVLIMT